MKLIVRTATTDDAPAIASLRTAVADHLTSRYGRGHWSPAVTDASVLRGIRMSRVLVARSAKRVIATLTLATKKPWAIDPRYFETVRRPLYLTDMAVEPGRQLQGIGRYILEEAKAIARAWPSEAIRLDAYDSIAGAGPFYAKCGFKEVGRATYRGVPLVYFELLLST